MADAAPLRLLVLGAHPDDAEIHAGGLACLYRQAGHAVKFVSVTNGQSGHHLLSGPPLVARRREEAARSAALIGAQAETWDWPDGALEPTLAVRAQIIREIRTFQPDLVLTHRTEDYHPDHRAVANAVRDACYMTTVPAVVPDAPALRRDPVVAYLPDNFTRPVPLRADVVVDTSEFCSLVTRMLACHESQVFEWLPYNQRSEHELPADAAGRLAWLEAWYRKYAGPRADRWRAELAATYGSARAAAVQTAEAFEISEYAAPLDSAARRRLFYFLP